MTPVRAVRSHLRFGIVGPGRVGTSLAHWLAARGARLVQVGARQVPKARQLADRLGAGAVEIQDVDSSGLDLLLVTATDHALPGIVESLAGRPQAAVVLHAAGAVPVEVLAPLRSTATEIGGLHPLRAFVRASEDVADAAAVVFAVGGDPGARRLARRIVAGWDARSVEIDDRQRPIYHLAASLAAGGVVTILAAAEALAEATEMPPEVAQGYLQLARQALEEASACDRLGAAITGPVARGDLQTLTAQLRALDAVAPQMSRFVAAVALETLRQRERSGTVPENAPEIRKILAKTL